MDAIELLEKQHREIERMLDGLDGLEDDTAQRARMFSHLADAVEAHSEIEEQMFYPAARAEQSVDLVDKSIAAHAEIKRLIADMRNLGPGDTAFEAKLSLLREHIQDHVKEEEFELFPEVQRSMAVDRIVELGTLMQAKYRSRIPEEREFQVMSEVERLEQETAEQEGIEFEPEVPLRPRS